MGNTSQSGPVQAAEAQQSAAHLAGRALGLTTPERLADARGPEDVYRPRCSEPERARRLDAWHRAVARARLSLAPAAAAHPPGGQ
ncbi:hypothetical protein E1265_05810 [Streptomyces sp. 8K308]|uniref:hypothetical protein n=1 Tax=Streptomyces sp. 8K308 TaxID=2530388 RepID=UPI00104AE350|nr:hypothetical protein [Streptomyces sp. 8K308]TDC25892.1 hypothetical protein E1265_05810 [Streptomyces sp. 8K308]